MKEKLMFILYSVIALIVTIILFVTGNNYIAAAIIVGLLIVGHREIWSLLRYRKLPPIDERIRENTNKAMRNSFIFLIIAFILTIIYYATNPYDYTFFNWEYVRISPQELLQRHLEYFIGELLLLAELVYLLSYLYYDRIKYNLEERMLKSPKLFLLASAISVSIFILNACFAYIFFPTTSLIVLHVIILWVSFLVFVIGIIGSSVLFIKGL